MIAKPKSKEAFRMAMNDIMLYELNDERYKKVRLYDEGWNVGVSYLDSIENRKLNNELGLNSNEGILNWYN